MTECHWSKSVLLKSGNIQNETVQLSVDPITSLSISSDFNNNISGQAAWFDGESWAYTEEIDSDVIGSTDNWTVSFWILPDLSNTDFDQWHSVMSSGDSTSSGRFQIDHNGNEQLRAFGYLAIDMEAEWIHFTYTKNTDNTDNQKTSIKIP
jgi:hypothetical protein